MGRKRLQILAVEPWLGGSHARMLETWVARSAHSVTVLGLPARNWKWRMEGGAHELAQRAAEHPPADVVLASDYLDLARFLGFLPAAWAGVPTVLYLHENQLTYPARPGTVAAERDLTHGFANVMSCLAADAIAFNSRFHAQSFGTAATELVARLPAPSPRDALARALARAAVVPPGVELETCPLGPGPPAGAPLRLAFNHRWEHDKDPGAFLAAVLEARGRGAEIELVLLGESFDEAPQDVDALAGQLEGVTLQRGFAPSRAEYARWLGAVDLVVSTARHEFFGVALLEGLAAGATPLAPDRLAYPEVLEPIASDALYDGMSELADRLVAAAADVTRWRGRAQREAMRAVASRFDSALTARALDGVCEGVA